MLEIITICTQKVTNVFERKRYPNFRNVTSKQAHGLLIFEISRVSNYGTYVFALLVLSVAFLWASWTFAAAILQRNANADFATRAVYCLPFVGFLFLWFFLGVRITLKRISSIEVSVGNGVLKWRQRTFSWTHEISVPEENVTAVVLESSRWGRKALKLKVNGKVYVLNDLLKDDLELLSRQLRMRLGMANSPSGI